MMDFAKAEIHAPVLGQMDWLGIKIHEDKSENVELQRKEMVSGFLACDDTAYEGILAAGGAGIYLCATLHSMRIMCRGSTSCSVIMGLVHCETVDSEF